MSIIGSAFSSAGPRRFTLPISIVRTLTADELRRHPTSAPESGYLPCPDLAGVHVMVVDDDRDALDLVKRVLERCHAQVTICASGAECVETVGDLRPTVLITDIGSANGTRLEVGSSATKNQRMPNAIGRVSRRRDVAHASASEK